MDLRTRCENQADILVFGWNYRPLGTFWRAARVGERLSPYVSLCCVAMAVSCRSYPMLLGKWEMLILFILGELTSGFMSEGMEV